ncbi:MAG: gliding motility protein GldL [Dysgonomonas sp.]
MGKIMRNFRRFLASKKGQILFNVLYSWGAAIVIGGAMFKIMHFKGGDHILMAGMIVEIIVFFAAGLDYSSTNDADTESTTAGGVVVGSGFLGGSAVGGSDTEGAIDSKKGKVGGGSSSPSVVIIGGGSGSGGVSGIGNIGDGQINTASNSHSQTASGALGGTPPEYAQSLSNTAQNLEEFSNTIHSLNEASQKILNAYKQVDEAHGFAENLATLNQNVSGLNEVFNGQLQTITEQMSAIRYINDSLQRMKNLYDGAIGDSYMFREESAKMTKHIEALNNVYARLLQAMTTNNNNMNQTNF